MELFELALLFLVAVLASTFVDQLLPRVSLPLVQIGIGAVVALFMEGGSGIVMDSELFLVLLIAPLLFDESRNANKGELWQNKGSIVSLAVGLVLVIVLAVGFTLHAIEPSIPLAAAFALGAALGPTDAVAVGSLSKEVRLSSRQHALLSGEALINDASGVVSCQFAIAAATTGAISLLDASLSFVVTFFGGLALGLVLGGLTLLATHFMRTRGYESVTTHVVFEVVTPFAVFLIAEGAGVSGILAVVAAGLLMALVPQPVSPASARLSLASSSMWEVLVFVANGIVFVLLGMELPQAILPGWNNNDMDNTLVIAAALVITALLVAVRFVWVLAMEALRRTESGKRAGVSGNARDALVTTLAGPKGAVTLSIVFTIPATVASGAAFPMRTTVICIASVVVLCTLLLANFAMPLVAPKKDDKGEQAVRNVSAEILRGVIAELEGHVTPQTAQAMLVVLRSYKARLEQLQGSEISDARLRALSEEVLAQQLAYVLAAVEEKRVGEESGRRCVDQLARMTRVLERQQGWRRKRFNPAVSARLLARGAVDWIKGTQQTHEEHCANLAFMVELERCALAHLEPIAHVRGAETTHAANVLVAEHRATLASLESRLKTMAARLEAEHDGGSTLVSRSIGSYTRRTIEMANDLYAQALRIELDQIRLARESGKINKTVAAQLREEVYLLQMGLNENRS